MSRASLPAPADAPPFDVHFRFTCGVWLALNLALLTGLIGAYFLVPVVLRNVAEPRPAVRDHEFELDPDAQQLLRLVNQARAHDPRQLPPLVPHLRLFQAARAHAAIMANQGTLDDEPDGTSVAVRVRDFGYPMSPDDVWTNLTASPKLTPAGAFQRWMAVISSKAHLLEGNAVHAGIGIIPDTKGDVYYCLILARPAR